MLRIISVFLLLIISQISFAAISTSNQIVAATPTTITTYGVNGYTASDKLSACQAAVSAIPNHVSPGEILNGKCHYYYDSRLWFEGDISISVYTNLGYTCSSGTLSDASGNPSSAGEYCNIQTSVDSCASYVGQSGYFWVNKVNPPSTICSGTCLASAVAVAGFPDADPLSWQYLKYTYTGATSGCTSDSGITDDATATAANAAAAERERLAKIQKAIDDAITACGGTGHYTRGTFNGNTVITCKESTANTTSNNSTTTNTTNNTDGSTTTTTTTTTNSSTSTNNNTSTTVNSDGSTTTTGGSSGGASGGSTAGTSGTTTTTTTTKPDGSTTSTTSSASSTVLPGTDASYDYQDTDRNDWNSKNFQTVIESNIDKLKGTALYGSVTGFFTVSFNGSCSASNFNASYMGAALSGSFDWCSNLAPFQVYIKAVVLFLCSLFAFRRAIE